MTPSLIVVSVPDSSCAAEETSLIVPHASQVILVNVITLAAVQLAVNLVLSYISPSPLATNVHGIPCNFQMHISRINVH